MNVYGKPDEQGRITFLALDIELQEAEIAAHSWQVIGALDVDDAEGRAAVMGNRWQGEPLQDADGRYNYKLADGAAVARTAEEKAADALPVPTPTQLDMVQAQVAYTAMMTDTLLEV